MFFGRQLFTYNQQQLSLTFSPKIPAQFFTQHEQNISYQLTNQTWVQEQLPAGTVLVNFLKDIPVIFHNPQRINTWEASITKIRIHPLTGQPYDVSGATIPNAKFIRDKQVNKLEVFF